MSGIVWSKFYWSDWESDPSLRLCSLAAQGLWMRMLCVAAGHDEFGYLGLAGRPLAVSDLARLTGISGTEAGVLVAELESNGVFSRDRQGRIYCRRMVRDAKRSAEARVNGSKGGNPSLCKSWGNPAPDKAPVKGALKPHKPRASTRVEDPYGSSNPGGAAGPASPPGGRAGTSTLDERGAVWTALRARAVERCGEDFARAWLDPVEWREADKAATCRLGFTAERLRRELRGAIRELGVSIDIQTPDLEETR